MCRNLSVLFLLLCHRLPAVFAAESPAIAIPTTHHRTERAALDTTTKRLLIDESGCSKILDFCPNLPHKPDDLQALECIQTLQPAELKLLYTKCQHFIWKHTFDLLDDASVLHTLQPNCTNDVRRMQLSCPGISTTIEHYPGVLLACFLDHREQIEDAACRAQLQRLESVAFSDFRLIGHFEKKCHADIERSGCGRLDAANTENKLSQGATVACLQERVETLSADCRQAVLHLAEQQAENVRLDKQLFAACESDVRTFCQDMRPGTGAIYQCLVRHRADQRMTARCGEQLARRDKLIAHDYRVSKGLARACRDDIKTHHCRRGVSDDKEVRLAQILLCLEAAHRNGTGGANAKSGGISAECLAEIDDHRRMLMADYRMLPEILTGCADDIALFCDKLHTGGQTIHCLMEHVRPAKHRRNKQDGGQSVVSAVCVRALELVIKASDAAEDWRVDPVLRDACKPVVDVACRDASAGDARVMSCLMEKLGTSYMSKDCERALMQIQYFVARDFKLDPQLYRHCKEDAVHFCHAKKTWDDYDNGGQMDPERGPMVLPCLHRYAYHPEPKERLKPNCLREVKRVMRQRAVSVDLIPEVEDECLDDLAALCFDKTEKGEEMQCLQDNIDKLKPKCKQAVTTYTIDEAANVELNPIIMTYCRTAMETNCAHILRSDRDDGDMMECLIAHKNDPDQRPDQKCRAAIEHFQITALKDYHFTYKFKEACRPHVIRYCPSSNTKYDVVACLSEVMRNDTLRGQRHTIPKECRQQVRAQLFQQRENIDFDPKLKQACRDEIKLHCSTVPHGTGQVLECLQTNSGHLGADCAHYLFAIKKSELADSSTDYTLMTQCREMLRQYCPKDGGVVGDTGAHALDCLKIYKDEPLFDAQCHLIVVNRMIVQNQDYRYNPRLQEACRTNIAEFCTPIVAKAKRDEELNGKVVQCLKTKFREGRLTQRCQTQMTEVLHEQALNYKLNPLLQAVCRNEIRIICKVGVAGAGDAASSSAEGAGGGVTADEHGQVEECLKMAFLEHRLMSSQCKYEVATMIEESRADIQVDPLLQQACQVDLMKYCSKLQSGNGRHLKCLQVVLNDASQALEPDCKSKLLKRMEMFQNSAAVVKQPPEDFGELYRQMSASKSKVYFMVVVLIFVFVVFAVGLLCGQFARRNEALKNK